MYKAHITISTDTRYAWACVVDGKGHVVARCGHTHRSRKPANVVDTVPAEVFANWCADRMLRRLKDR